MAKRKVVAVDPFVAAPLLLPQESAGPRGAAPLPSNVDHMAAQAELDHQLFPHYLLGRQLALEETVRELLLLVPDKTRFAIADRLRENADAAIQRLEAGEEDAKSQAATCGYICTLLQQGF